VSGDNFIILLQVVLCVYFAYHHLFNLIFLNILYDPLCNVCLYV
jgi:hypothetical protein